MIVSAGYALEVAKRCHFWVDKGWQSVLIMVELMGRVELGAKRE